MRMLRATLFLLFLTLSLTGCGEKKASKVHMELKDIPENIMKIAREKLPGVTFDVAYREPNGSFELRGKDNRGKVREIDIRPDGTVEELQ